MGRSGYFVASALIGRRIRTAGGDALGKIEEFIVDPETGKILYAVVTFDGIVGAGDNFFAVPWRALQGSPTHDYLILEANKAFIEHAPSFDGRHWPDMTDAAWQKTISDYYRDYYRAPDARLVAEPLVAERTVVVDRAPARRSRPVSIFASVFITLVLLGLIGLTYLVATRGWDRATNDIANSAQGVVYAMKETSQDATLTAKVKTALSLSSRVPARSINVDSHDGVVTLRGEMPNEEVRSIAETITRDTVGVDNVQNQMTVNPAAVAQEDSERMRNQVTDLEAKYRVHDAVVKDAQLKGQTIQIDVNNQRVTLNGTVETSDQKYLAEQLTWQVEGVKSVDNRLNVTRPGPPESVDAVTSRKVDFALYSTRALDMTGIHTEAMNGTVELSGVVYSAAEKLLAEKAALEVEEVRQVVNNLEIRK